jgi:hypothetical protein
VGTGTPSAAAQSVNTAIDSFFILRPLCFSKVSNYVLNLKGLRFLLVSGSRCIQIIALNIHASQLQRNLLGHTGFIGYRNQSSGLMLLMRGRAARMHENQPVEGPAGSNESSQRMSDDIGTAIPGRKRNLQQKILHLRRSHSRVEALVNVYIFWRSDGREDLAKVKNLSFSGLFIETEKSKDPGDAAELHFLVQEGQIRANAVVRRAKPGHGLGLKLMAVHDNDRRRLAELMKRLRSAA